MSFRKFLPLLLLCSLLFGFPADAAPEQKEEVCDPSLMGNAGSEMAYKLRGQHCEGIYRLEVGSLEVRLESLTDSFKSFDTASSHPLEIHWSAPPEAKEGSVHLQANALLPRTFYRMDAVVADRAGPFSWPCNLLDRQGYGRDDLGIFGWWEAPGEAAEKVYLPLHIAQNQRPERTGAYELAFTPRRRLEEVYISVSPANVSGESTGAFLWADQALEYGQYLSGNPVFVDLPQLTTSGYYRIDIKVSFSEDRSQNDHFVIYHQEYTP